MKCLNCSIIAEACLVFISHSPGWH